MPRDSPRQAVEHYLAPFRTAVSCVTHGSLIMTTAQRPEVNEVFALAINRSEPIVFRRNPSITFRGGQFFRILRDGAIEDSVHRVQTVKYFYQFSTTDGHEILNFQWTPEEGHLPGRKTFPHLHIGRGLLGDRSAIFPATFHKKHVPTGHVSFASIIRFAIEELGVRPLRDDWSAVLDRSQPVA